MNAEELKISTKNPEFVEMMKTLVKGVRRRKKDTTLLDKSKEEFKKAGFSLAYSEEQDRISLVRAGNAPLIFDCSKFE